MYETSNWQLVSLIMRQVVEWEAARCCYACHPYEHATSLISTTWPGPITDPADVAAYRDAFSQLRKLAVTGPDAQAMLRQISLA
jgi:hypothetical protein